MNEVEYQHTQDSILMIARLVQDLPLNEFVAAIDRAHGVAPIVDPTLYRTALYEHDGDGLTGIEKMDWLQKLARDLAKFKGDVGSMKVTIEERKATAV